MIPAGPITYDMQPVGGKVDVGGSKADPLQDVRVEGVQVAEALVEDIQRGSERGRNAAVLLPYLGQHLCVQMLPQVVAASGGGFRGHHCCKHVLAVHL